MGIVGIYKLIADNISDIVESGAKLSDYFSDILEDMDNSELGDGNTSKDWFVQNIEVEKEKLSRKHFSQNYDFKIVSFVRELQGIVVDEWGSVDVFLESNGILVCSTFANISLQAGYPIEVINIEGDIS